MSARSTHRPLSKRERALLVRWRGNRNHPLIIDAINVFNATIVNESSQFSLHGIGDVANFRRRARLAWRERRGAADHVRHFASGNNFDDVICQAHRKAIRSAVKAADKGVPLPVARGILAVEMMTGLNRIIENEKTDPPART
jgi:hypothetical protein